MKKKISTILAILLTSSALFSDEFFEKQIRPALVKNCYSCHSAKAERVKGDVRLDTQEGLEAALKGNLLSDVITNKDMPPKGMSPSDANLIVSWVRRGALGIKTMNKASGLNVDWGTRVDNHWAFQPQTKPEMPQFDMDPHENPIDNFIIAKLQDKNLKLSPRANKRILIRRAYYDIIGLPPSGKQVQDFINDDDPGAWNKVIDELLDSKHYGERWGRHWLDIARYSDYKGGANNRRTDPRYAYAWTYRNWVIESLNADKPYDIFIKEQLAADLIGSKPADLRALGFLTVGRRDRNTDDVIDDRIDTISKAFLGLTVSCARCHDHKFDPITQKDYYAWHGILSSIQEPDEFDLPVAKDTRKDSKFADYDTKRKVADKSILDYKQKHYAKWYDHFRRNGYQYITHSHNYYQEIALESRRQYSRTNKVADVTGLVGNRLSAWQREMNSNNPFWNPYKELIKISSQQWNISLNKMSQDKVKYDFGVVRSLQLAKPKTKKQIAQWYSNAFKSSWEAYTARKGKISNKLHKDCIAILTKAKGPGDLGDVDRFFLVLNNRERTRYENGLRTEVGKLINLEWTHPAVPPRAMAVTDKAKPVTTKIYKLGNRRSLGAPAPRAFIAYLEPKGRPYPANTSGRVQLAESIINNQLTSRVIVNRIWQGHFGEGFVSTPDDMGVQSNTPKHPELIDWMAVYLRDTGWSLKQLHKLIMVSDTYQQASTPEPRAEFADSGNLLFHRQNIKRLEFELLRDTLFKLSGNLDSTYLAGPVDLLKRPYTLRRSVYGQVDRRRVPELMSAFDFANPNLTTGKRFSSTIPQQSLFMLNNQMVIDQAKTIVSKTSPRGSMYENVSEIYRIIYQRPPTLIEGKIAMRFVSGASSNKINGLHQFAQVLLLSNELIYIN